LAGEVGVTSDLTLVKGRGAAVGVGVGLGVADGLGVALAGCSTVGATLTVVVSVIVGVASVAAAPSDAESGIWTASNATTMPSPPDAPARRSIRAVRSLSSNLTHNHISTPTTHVFPIQACAGGVTRYPLCPQRMVCASRRQPIRCVKIPGYAPAVTRAENDRIRCSTSSTTESGVDAPAVMPTRPACANHSGSNSAGRST